MVNDLKQLISNIDETGSNWDNAFFKALKSNDMSTMCDLLITADKIYMDEYFIISSIDNFTKKDKNIHSTLNSLKNNKHIKNIIIDNSTLKFEYNDRYIKLGIFSEMNVNL